MKLSNELKIANVHKDKFLATVSHEMRTPLNAIMGYLGLLDSDAKILPPANTYIHGAQHSAAHLLTVINDLLDYSQIQQGRLVLNPQTIDLHRVLKESFKILEPKAIDIGIVYEIVIDASVPTWVRIDPHRLTQIILNLLGNALKFTPSGSITMTAIFKPDLESIKNGFFYLRITDTGIGIAKDYIHRIMEPFFQINALDSIQTDNSLKGNGLGLSITKGLVENLRGTLTVSSVVNQGASFEIKIPLELAPPNRQIDPSSTAPIHEDDIYLLIVDDHATNRLIASATVKRWIPNARIEEAKNGTQAIEMMQKNLYDLVLMDLVMPDYSGVEVVEKIRAQCQPPFSNVSVVALTANVADDAIQACKEVGIDVLLPKPFDREILIRTILQYSKNRNTEWV